MWGYFYGKHGAGKRQAHLMVTVKVLMINQIIYFTFTEVMQETYKVGS